MSMFAFNKTTRRLDISLGAKCVKYATERNFIYQNELVTLTKVLMDSSQSDSVSSADKASSVSDEAQLKKAEEAKDKSECRREARS